MQKSGENTLIAFTSYAKIISWEHNQKIHEEYLSSTPKSQRMNPAQTVLFAIQAGVRLGQQIKGAYIDNIKRRELKLPLPDFPSKIGWETAESFFEGDGEEYLKINPRIDELLKKARKDDRLPSKEARELTSYYHEYLTQKRIEKGTYKAQAGITADYMSSLLSIRQWNRGSADDPTRSTLQRVGGTLAEIAIDFFKQRSDLMADNSPHSQSLQSFLNALDKVQFASAPVKAITADLIDAALTAFIEVPNLVKGEKAGHDFIEAVTEGIAIDLRDRIAHIRKQAGGANLTAEEHARQWGRTVFRSILENTGDTVFEDSEKFLHKTNEGQQALITGIGSALLNTMLLEVVREDEPIDVSKFFSPDSVDGIARAAVLALSENPELIGVKNNGINNMLTQLVTDLANYPEQLGLNLLPEVCRLTLELTAGNVNALWSGDKLSEPADHLLITGTRYLLDALSRPPDGESEWKPVFGKVEALELVDTVMQEVVANNAWVKSEDGKMSILEQALTGALSAFEGISVTDLNADARTNILKSALKAVATRQQFCDRIQVDGEDKYLLTESIDMVFDLILGDKSSAQARWALARQDTLELITGKVLEKLTKSGVSETLIASLEKELSTEFQKLEKGEQFSVKELILKLEA